MIDWWQQLPAKISPILFTLGPIQVRYYGLMYVVSFLVIYFLALKRSNGQKHVTRMVMEDYFFWIIIGVVLGSRLGYVLFYDWEYFSHNLLQILIPFDFSEGIRFIGISGLSYHGGVLGFIGTTYFFCRSKNIPFLTFTDFIVPLIPLGYMFGRIGNFLNHELYGRVTQVPWGMYFPTAATHELRHASQLYEAFFEGFICFVLLSFLSTKVRSRGFLSAMYLISYGAVRFCIEFFRQPDAHLGFVWMSFSMGQLLCLAMILAGALLWVCNLKESMEKS
ncbi:MAG: phosphatidylglycerol:prolipoprotein diacylglycerol transferase [Lysobacterales bacterium]|jgi:phosphatidylglycerol:prolipoprotein diacylglycerol transferase